MPRISEIDPAHAPEAIQKIIADHVADGHALTAEKRTLLHNAAAFNARDCLERREMRSATQGEKAALVQELRKEGHRLNDLLDAIRLSRSTYYYELSKTDKVKERNADLSSEIVAIFNENRKRYGVRRVHHELLNGFR